MVGQSGEIFFAGLKKFRNAAAPAAILMVTRRELGRPVRAWVAQLVERVLGKDEVTGSIPVPGSRSQSAQRSAARRGGIRNAVSRGASEKFAGHERG